MKICKVVLWVLSVSIIGAIGVFFWMLKIKNGFRFNSIFWGLTGLYFLITLHIAIHEAGHALFGKLTGYKMTSFRVRSFMWSWLPDGRVVFKKYSVDGTAGQCLMDPPDYNEDNFPFRLYLLGGVLANLVMSGLVLVLFDITWLSLTFSFIGFEMAVLNGIPNEYNDGKNILLLSQRKEYRYLHYLGLKTNQLSNRGMVLAEMPKKYFEKIPRGPNRTHLDDYYNLLRVNFFWDTQQWEKYQQELEMLWEELDNVESIYRLPVKVEVLFYLLLFRPNDSRIEEIWQDKKFRRMLNDEDSVNQRVKAAYLYYREKNLSDALDMLNSAEDYLDGFPTIGSRKREAQLINWLRDLMIERGAIE